MKEFDEICSNCGFTFGSHLANTVYHEENDTVKYPRDCCPGHEGCMDWNKGPGTTFKSTNTFKEEKDAKN